LAGKHEIQIDDCVIHKK